MAYLEDNRYRSAYGLDRGESMGDRSATYKPSTEGATPEVKPLYADELGKPQTKPVGMQPQQSNQELQVESLTKRPGGLMVSGGVRKPDITMLGGGLLAETNQLGKATPQNTSPKPPAIDNDYINKQMLVENNAMSRGPAGLTRYTQGPNGELLRQGSGGEISTLSGPPVRNRQSPAAEAAGTTDAWYNNGYTGGVAQYRKEKEQQAIYQNMDGLMADAMNPNLSQEARANAQKMFTALAGRVSDLDSQYTQSQGQQIQGRNQQAQLGLQERQYNDQAPEREFSANVARKKNEVLQGDNGFEKLGLSQRDKDRYKAFTLDKNDPQTGVKQGESAAVIDTYTGKVNGGGQQKANLQALQALYQNPDKIDEFENKFGYRPEGF